MKVLLISTYELGHQPLSLAAAAAGLADAGLEVATLDLAVTDWDPGQVEEAGAIAVSVPMHTAMRLAVDVVGRVRARHPDTPIALFGLYANVPAGLRDVATFAGEYTQPLTEWVLALQDGQIPDAHRTLRSDGIRRQIPLRAGLPELATYARLELNGEERLAGYVEASSGCRHRCRHCPVPVVYDGRINITSVDAVMADLDQQVAAGARHVTFGDPDFLNAPAHSESVVAGLTERYPDLTFDVTVKVEHILDHQEVWGPWAAAGCVFVVSAFEVMSDDILARLDKGHTAVEAGKAVHLLREHGIEIRPSWLPFTPWTTMDDVVEVFSFIADHDLIPNTDPVQLAIRLLVPEGSLLVDLADSHSWLGAYDPAALTYGWSAVDPQIDDLQRELAELAEQLTDQPATATFGRMWEVVAAAAGRAADELAIPAGAATGRPRMTEPWFC